MKREIMVVVRALKSQSIKLGKGRFQDIVVGKDYSVTMESSAVRNLVSTGIVECDMFPPKERPIPQIDVITKPDVVVVDELKSDGLEKTEDVVTVLDRFGQDPEDEVVRAAEEHVLEEGGGEPNAKDVVEGDIEEAENEVQSEKIEKTKKSKKSSYKKSSYASRKKAAKKRIDKLKNKNNTNRN